MKILVIDDDPAMTELLMLILQSSTSTVYTANSGNEGIAAAALYQPDVIILDLMMPEVDGWKVCQTVRQTSQVPILILSALDNPSLVAKALDAGADDYLIKPVPTGVLVAHLNTLMRRIRVNNPICVQ